MVLLVCFIVYVIACAMEDAARRDYYSKKRTDDYYRTLMKELKKEKEDVPSRVKRTTRHIAQDKEGNILGEEIIEEEL